jgi:dTDP-4-dehydrorhamnose 3,5-epimerase
LRITPQALPEVLLIEPRVFSDARGFFLESYHADRYREAGVRPPFVQDNWSHSVRGTLRGLHFQHPRAQGKLVSCVRGNVFDVAVDIRRGSPTFGRWVGAELSDTNKYQLWVPPGFAHGFCVLSEEADFLYKCTEVYVPEDDGAIVWDDPSIGIEWPISTPILSAKDAAAPLLRDVARLPSFVS